MNRMQLLKVVLFAEDEDDGVVPKPATGMHRQGGRFVHDHHLIVLCQDLDRLGGDWRLVAMHRVSEKIIILPEKQAIRVHSA